MNVSGTVCKVCGSATDLYLCTGCIDQLRTALGELAWLLTQLDTTVRRQDKLSTGAIGGNNDNPSPINFGAMETARDTRKALLHIVTTIAKAHTGRVPQLHTAATPDLARWLKVNVLPIARHPDAATINATITHLVDDDDHGRPGPLYIAINRTDRRFAGPCPTIRGHNPRGERIECGTMLYADTDEPFARCPKCDTEIDVKQNRLRAAAQRDIVTEKKLLEILASEAKYDGWPVVSRVKLYEWIRAGRLEPKGWVHEGQVVKFHIRRGDPRVFSLKQARDLRWRDHEAKAAHA